MSIALGYQILRKEIPEEIAIVGAAKGRTKQEILEFIKAGGIDIGMNYVQEAEKLYKELGKDAKKLRWHMIGRLQKNKISRAVKIFDVIQTIDNYETAFAINKRIKEGKMPVFMEINIADEKGKHGIKPEYAIIEDLARKISSLEHLKLDGVMAMGPMSNPETIRPYFRKTKEMFDKINKLQGIKMRYKSMGMSDSYKTAIEEGSNMVRLGNAIFGKRNKME